MQDFEHPKGATFELVPERISASPEHPIAVHIPSHATCGIDRPRCQTLQKAAAPGDKQQERIHIFAGARSGVRGSADAKNTPQRIDMHPVLNLGRADSGFELGQGAMAIDSSMSKGDQGGLGSATIPSRGSHVGATKPRVYPVKRRLFSLLPSDQPLQLRLLTVGSAQRHRPPVTMI